MPLASRLNLLLVAFFSVSQIAARQIDSGAHPGERVYLDVAVSPRSGPPIANLQQKDFTIFDNDAPQSITSFQSIDRAHAQINVTIVLDALTISPRAKATALDDIKRFLNANEGELAYPMAIDFVTNKGLEFRAGPSIDGKAISASLDKNAIAIRDIGDTARSFVVFDALVELVTLERDKPGRKLILFVSPGWPPVVRPDFEHKASEKEVQQFRLQVFGNIVQLTRQLHEGQITIYSLDPPAVDDVDSRFTNGTTHLSPSHNDVKFAGVRSPSDVRWDDLALQTLALQSGGLALYSGNDLALSLRECLAGTSAFYELSFDLVITDQPNQYHHLKVQIAQPDLTARTRQGYYSQPWPAAKFAAEEAKLSDANTADPQVPDLDMRDASEDRAKNLTAQVLTYVDMSLEQLTKQIPELKDLQPATDQKQLSLILKNTGRTVDAFIHNVGDLIADEDLTQQKLNPDGKIKARQRTQDDYLILQHGYDWGANSEYRMDKRGNRLESIGLLKGFLVTAGYALNCITFSTISQPQSNFRYLGDQRLGTREAFVVSFAQRPGDATFKTVMRGPDSDVEMLTQGILWIDKNSFQILRLRTDLLAPNAKLRLRKITTSEDFGEVKLQSNPDPLWLPNDVTVFIEIAGEKYRNLHHYTNYRRYQVAVKIGNSP